MTLKVDGTNGVLQAYDYQVLTTGFSYTFAAGTQTLVINPAGTLATGTITMPASPADGMVITVTSTQPITALTINANTGQSINNGGALGLAAGGSLSYVYRLANTTWQPFNASLPIGVGQTWQDVSGSRTSGTTYTNTTGRPIMVSFTGSNSTTGASALSVTINGVTLENISRGSGYVEVYSTQVIVPSGNTYVLTWSGLAASPTWAELR